jgi:pyruvate dehydrogenase E1 component
MADAPATINRDAVETREWLDSLDEVIARRGPRWTRRLLEDLQIRAQQAGVVLPVTAQTPYVNTIPVDQEPPYPGDHELERRIRHLVRWNAMAMVVRANRGDAGVGGHISTFASICTLYEVGFHHFFRGRDDPSGGDFIYFQGHASPGNYARAFLEGRLSETQLENFRRELADGGGLASYPHPHLMGDFWEFPTVSMGLGPIQAIYRARFMRYLEHRGLRDRSDARVWCFVGDGEIDEPETLAAISLAARERLDNLIFVVNCNLQRLDGPVRGNGKIVQEVEASFRGVGWNVIKVLWGREWDELFARDESGRLIRHVGELVDGEFQRFTVEGGGFIREYFFQSDNELASLVEDKTDDELWRMRLGGHDPEKVYAAYHAAVRHRGAPTVIIARTVKGYGLGEAGEGRNVTHKQKKLNEEELRAFRDRFDVPIRDEDIADAPFHRPDADAPEIAYLFQRRKELGGFVPRRCTIECDAPPVEDKVIDEFAGGSEGRPVATTMAVVRLISRLLRQEELGPRIVPIVPDEARTFGLEALFRRVGIYSSVGQLYEPVDARDLMYYREAKDGQVLEEGITEAGSMSSFIAAGTAHAGHGTWTVPFFLFYSMFGFQRVGDLIWAAGDAHARGFLIGATAGRTTLSGEGLQHQDGQSQLFAQAIPSLRAYDPAFAYEVAMIVRDGLRRMFTHNEDVFYYLTAYNEPYVQPPMPEGVETGILRGAYRLHDCLDPPHKPKVHLLAAGPIVNEAVRAQRTLWEQFKVPADVWSVTSFSELRRDAIIAERWNRLHPDESPRRPYVLECFEEADETVFIAATDYVRAVSDGIARWLPGPLTSLGTDGFGRSDTREALRAFFENDADHIAFAALVALARQGRIDTNDVVRAREFLSIGPEKPAPMNV